MMVLVRANERDEEERVDCISLNDLKGEAYGQVPWTGNVGIAN